MCVYVCVCVRACKGKKASGKGEHVNVSGGGGEKRENMLIVQDAPGESHTHKHTFVCEMFSYLFTHTYFHSFNNTVN